jgi:hypothetical protein
LFGLAVDIKNDLASLGAKVFAGNAEYTAANQIGLSTTRASVPYVITTPISVVLPGGEKIEVVAANTSTFSEAAADNERLAVNRINAVVGLCVNALAKLYSGILEHIPGRTYEAKINETLLKKESGLNVTTSDELKEICELKATTVENSNSKTFFVGNGALGVQAISGSLFGAFDILGTYSSTKIPITEHTVDGVAVVSKSKVQPLSSGGSLVYGEEVSSNTIGTIEIKERYSYGCEGKVGLLVGGRAAIFVGGGVTRINNEFKHIPDNTNYEGAIKYISETASANPNDGLTAVDVSVVDASEVSKKEFSENKSKFVGHFCVGVRVFVDCNSRFFVELKTSKFFNSTTSFETPAYKGSAHDLYASGTNNDVKTSSAYSASLSAGVSLGGG